jgi:hypothetical protein
MTETWINVNTHRIRGNAKNGTNEPPIRVSRGKHGQPQYGHRVTIDGPSQLVYDANKPVLPCGARLAIRTESEVTIHED